MMDCRRDFRISALQANPAAAERAADTGNDGERILLEDQLALAKTYAARQWKRRVRIKTAVSTNAGQVATFAVRSSYFEGIPPMADGQVFPELGF